MNNRVPNTNNNHCTSNGLWDKPNNHCSLSISLCWYSSYLPTPPLGRDMTQGQFFKRSLTGLNSEFSFSSAEEPSLSYYLPIAGGRIIGFIPFPRVLVLCEMQSVSSRIWTRVAVSISYDDNDYTTGTSKISLCWYSSYLPTPSARAGYDTMSIF